MDLVFKAARIAKFAHRNQYRKYPAPGEPPQLYIKHPADVANYLTLNADVLNPHQFNPNIEAIIAGAWLHDVLEDTETDPFFISEMFIGTCVPYYVKALTIGGMESKAEYIERLKYESPSTRVIKMADRICNLRDCRYAPEDFKKYYAKQSEELFETISPGVPDVFAVDYQEALKCMRA